MVTRSHIVQAEHLSRGVVELVMVDFDVGKRSVELHVHIALPRGVFYSRHIELWSVRRLEMNEVWGVLVKVQGTAPSYGDVKNGKRAVES